MLHDREDIETEVRNLRIILTELDSSLRRFAAGDLAHRIEMRFPRGYEGLRSDFNRGLAMLSSAVDAIVGSVNQLRAHAEDCRETRREIADARNAQAEMLSMAVTDAGELAQSASRQKLHAEHASVIAHNARLDARQPKQAVEAVAKVVETIHHSVGPLPGLAERITDIAHRAGREAEETSSSRSAVEKSAELRQFAESLAIVAAELSGAIEKISTDIAAAAEPAERSGREIAAMSLYVDALDEHIREIATAAAIQMDAAAELREHLANLSKSVRDHAGKERSLDVPLDRMNWEIGEIDRQASRYIPVVVQPPPPRDPSHPGSHLRLVKS